MIVRLLLLVYLAVIALVVLTPEPIDRAHRAEVLALAAFLRGSGLISLQYWQVEFTANVLLFLPLGLLLTLSLGRSRVSLWLPPLCGVVLSAAAETGQLLLLPDRIASPSDVISNTLGVLLGWCVALPLRRSPTPVEEEGHDDDGHDDDGLLAEDGVSAEDVEREHATERRDHLADHAAD